MLGEGTGYSPCIGLSVRATPAEELNEGFADKMPVFIWSNSYFRNRLAIDVGSPSSS